MSNRAVAMAATCWSRLIRFVPEGTTGKVVYGDVVGPDFGDIGARADAGTLEARLINTDSSGPFSPTATLTETVVKVKQLLGPLDSSICGDIKCIGLNYKKHSGRAPPPLPSLFVKPVTCLADYNDAVPIPGCAQDNEADYEAELCVVIGADCKNVSPENALECVAGYTAGNDVSARKWQRNPERAGGVPQWCYAKGFDKFAPIGPCIVSTKIIPDPAKLDMELSVNGELRQQTSISDLLFDGSTLRRGTVIMTGTPSGVGCTGPETEWRSLKHGDAVAITISEIGTLRHTIVYE